MNKKIVLASSALVLLSTFNVNAGYLGEIREGMKKILSARVIQVANSVNEEMMRRLHEKYPDMREDLDALKEVVRGKLQGRDFKKTLRVPEHQFNSVELAKDVIATLSRDDIAALNPQPEQQENNDVPGAGQPEQVIDNVVADGVQPEQVINNGGAGADQQQVINLAAVTVGQLGVLIDAYYDAAGIDAAWNRVVENISEDGLKMIAGVVNNGTEVHNAVDFFSPKGKKAANKKTKRDRALALLKEIKEHGGAGNTQMADDVLVNGGDFITLEKLQAAAEHIAQAGAE